ncbi:WXG100 family type VII secretion target [Listeria goaensis]|uniref:WXG100 family type VII secretion target n=1 Tax=Listeria goaensis TaxID=1649188 RepID=UPI000B5915A6|nr:WXG100 family type VII secretion target [Listeria goaensis]
MSDLVFDGSKVEEAISSAKVIEDSLQTTHEKCTAIVQYVNSAKWSGKSRDAFLTYMEIIEQYHADVNKNYKKQKKALKNLKSYSGDFEESSISREVKNL